tara:strand:+ start:347 stop:598 length:252 start_codon:yes stop_codon:yes gene_type:complete
VNLATYTANSSMRKSFYSSTANNFTATITDNAAGEITLTMTASETASLKPGRYVYDLLITDDAGTKSRIVEGIVSVTPGTTQT